MKKSGLILLLIVCLLFSGCNYPKKTNDYNEYMNYVYDVHRALEYMPTLNELGDYTKITATRNTTNNFVIFADTVTIALFLEYDEDAYNKQLEYINENYSFFEESPDLNYLDIDAKVNGYDIKTVIDETALQYIDPYSYSYGKDDTWYHDVVQTALMIGFNDVDNKICYLYRSNTSLDVLDDLESHIKECFYMV
ncbi:MAG: hypothetical protein IJ408_04255 [Clostridia bacterium]|nr:hypothetical protein [Clostridia bacterium]